MICRVITLLVAALMLAAPARAHETTKSFLRIDRNNAVVEGVLELAFRDLEVAVWLDEDFDGAITQGEVELRRDALAAYVSARLVLEAGGSCTLDLASFKSRREGGIDYLVMPFSTTCTSAQAPLRVTSRIFSDIDPDHRLFLSGSVGEATGTAVLDSSRPQAVLDPQRNDHQSNFVSYFLSGMSHLLGGYDHLVFLLVLILPALRVTRQNRRQALVGVVTAVTGFTIAHALTLTAAMTDMLRPRAVVIEMLIALSILLTAIDNLRPFIPAPRPVVAASFGIIHGFGFASALGTLQLEGWPFVVALAGFNFGIEVAQIALVLLCVPLLFFIGVGGAFIRTATLAAAAAGLSWFIIRAVGTIA